MKKTALDKMIFACLIFFALSVVFSVTAAEVSLFAVIALLLAKHYSGGTFGTAGEELKTHPLLLPWTVYIGICLLTALTAYYPAKGLGQLNSDFLKYVCLSTLLLAVKKEHLPVLAAAYTVAAIASALIGIEQVVRSVMDHVTPVKRASAFMNAVRYGEVMAIAAAFAISRTLYLRAEDSWISKTFYGAAAALIFGAVVLSRTRGAYLGFAVFLACLFALAKGRRLRLLLLTVGLAAVGIISAVINPVVRERFAITEQKANAAPVIEEAISIRLELWSLGADMVKAHPILGIGPDNIKPMFKTFRPGLIYDSTWGSLHNLYLHQAAERGILGLGAILFLFTALFIFALRNLKAACNHYTLWAACALPAFYAMNLTEISFQHVHTSFAIFLALAASSAAAKNVPDK